MCARYGDIESRDLAGELNAALPHFIYWLMTKVGLIEIATDNDNYAYAIFETMNDRGKPLSPVDMLKAYLLAPIEDAEQRRGANQIWKQQVLNLISGGGEHEPERAMPIASRHGCVPSMLTPFANGRPGPRDKDWELIGSAFHRWTHANRVRLKLGDPPNAAKHLALIQNDFPFFVSAYQLIMKRESQVHCWPGGGVLQCPQRVYLAEHSTASPLCPSDDEIRCAAKCRQPPSIWTSG